MDIGGPPPITGGWVGIADRLSAKQLGHIPPPRAARRLIALSVGGVEAAQRAWVVRERSVSSGGLSKPWPRQLGSSIVRALPPLGLLYIDNKIPRWDFYYLYIVNQFQKNQ